MKDAKLSNIQLGLLTFGYLYGTIAITDPVLAAKSDAWIASIIGYIGGTILITMYLFISKMNAGKTLTEILESCFGKVIGKAISILYISYFLHKAAMNLRGFGEFMVITSYPETPMIVIIIVFMIAVFYVVKKGLESIGKIGEITVPIIPIPILAMTTSLLTIKYFIGFRPILHEIAPVLKGAFNFINVPFGDLVVFLMVFPYTNKEKGRFKATYIGISVFCILHMLSVVRDLLVIGPSIIDFFMFPNHLSAQMIPGISIEPLVDINLVLGGGVKICLLLYGATKATAEIFNIEDYTPLLSAFVVFIVVLSIWVYSNVLEWQGGLQSIVSAVYSLPFQVIIPLLMLIISMFKQRKKADIKSS